MKQAKAAGKSVLVIDKCPHIAGNVYTEDVEDYPVNDAKNGALYAQYRALAEKEPNVIFGGRLGEYKYYDMDQVIAEALKKWEQIM